MAHGHVALDPHVRAMAPFFQRVGLAATGWLIRTGWQRIALKMWWCFLFSDRTVSVRLPDDELRVTVRCDTPDPTVFERIFIADEYGAMRSLEGCKTIVDCGAYVGYSTLYFSRAFPDAKIIAVEPDETNMEMLRANTSSCSNVIAIRSAIWSRRCNVRIKNPNHAPWSFTVEEGGSLPATTIADIAEEHGAIDFLKIDIEGAERDVFASGYEEWLPPIRMLIIELHDYLRPGSSETFHRAVARYDFRSRSRGENVILTRE